MLLLLLFSHYVQVHSVLSTQSCPALCNHGLLDRLLCSMDSPGKNAGVDCHFLLQGTIPTQGSNLCLLHWQTDSLPLSHMGSPLYLSTYRCV